MYVYYYVLQYKHDQVSQETEMSLLSDQSCPSFVYFCIFITYLPYEPYLRTEGARALNVIIFLNLLVVIHDLFFILNLGPT